MYPFMVKTVKSSNCSFIICLIKINLKSILYKSLEYKICNPLKKTQQRQMTHYLSLLETL